MTEHDPDARDEDHSIIGAVYERSFPGLNAVGRDRAMAHASNARWAALEDARDREIEAESEWFDRVTSRCYTCQRTLHETGVCDKHRRQFGIPE